MQLKEELEGYQEGSTFWDPRRIARIAIFIALSAVGALVKVPSPTGTVALDACSAFFTAITFGAKEGSIVAFLGHILTAAITGFPLGVPTHLYIALQMAVWVSIFWYVATKINLILAVVIAILCNGILSALLIIPIGGFGLAAALMLPLTVGAAINVIIASFAYLIVSKSNMV